jgi:hypothetical protein
MASSSSVQLKIAGMGLELPSSQSETSCLFRFLGVTPKIPSLKKMLATIRIFISKVNEFE